MHRAAAQRIAASAAAAGTVLAAGRRLAGTLAGAALPSRRIGAVAGGTRAAAASGMLMQLPGGGGWHAAAHASSVRHLHSALRAERKRPHTPLSPFESEMILACKNNDIGQAQSVYARMQEESIAPSVEFFDRYAFILGHHRLVDEVAALFAERRRLELPPTESFYSTIVSVFGEGGRFDEAIKVLSEMSSSGVKTHLRSYRRLVHSLALAGETRKAFGVLDTLITQGFHPKEDLSGYDEYCDTLAALVNACAKETDLELRNLFVEKILAKFRSEGCKIPANLFEATKAWFESAKKSDGSPEWSVTTSQITYLGKCRCCSTILESIELSPEQVARLTAMLNSIIASSNLDKEMRAFNLWLERTGPVDVVVDGLNVGFWGVSSFAPNNIASAVNYFHKQNKKVLVLARDHIIRKRQKDEAAYFQDLLQRGLLYLTPSDVPDDYFFMFAALKNALNVELVTNDALRDHGRVLAQTVSGEDFYKWQRGHQVKFDIQIESKRVAKFVPFKRQIYDPIVQSTENTWHIPARDADIWLCCVRADAASG